MTMSTRLKRSDKNKIDDQIGLYHEFVRSPETNEKVAITMSDLRKTKIRKEILLENNDYMLNGIETDEQKSYFVNKCNARMLERRNSISKWGWSEYVNPDSDILYHSIDDFLRHACFVQGNIAKRFKQSECA